LLHFPPKGSLITADGARAFPNACQNNYSDKKFLFAAVNHQKNIFTKRYKYRQALWGKRNRVIVAGAQQLDSSWRHLKKWRPVAFPQKKNHTVNKIRYEWAYSFVWRHNTTLRSSIRKELPGALWS